MTAIALAPANDRGFLKGKFLDRYGAECSIQKSSLATEDCIGTYIRLGTRFESCHSGVIGGRESHD